MQICQHGIWNSQHLEFSEISRIELSWNAVLMLVVRRRGNVVIIFAILNLIFHINICRNYVVRLPNPLAPGNDIQIHVSWGTRLELCHSRQSLTFNIFDNSCARVLVEVLRNFCWSNIYFYLPNMYVYKINQPNIYFKMRSSCFSSDPARNGRVRPLAQVESLDSLLFQ